MFAAIPFPDLSPDLISVEVFGFTLALRWYALAYIAGLLIAWRLALASVRRPALWPERTPPMNPGQVEDLLTWIIIGVILGGRLGFVLFYQPSYYLANPGQIPRIWEGGMAFHGGLLGVILAAWIYTLRHKLPVLSTADMIAHTVPTGLLLGRLANFVNGELWGRQTDMPWGVVFPGHAAQDCFGIADGLCARHPSQLYEAGLEGLVLGALLLWLVYRRGALRRPGVVTGTFFAGYGTARFIVEFFRQPDAQFVSAGNPLGLAWQVGGYGLTMGQLLSLPMIALGVLADLAGATVSLLDRITARIRSEGPISVADYMADCLLHPVHGYYMTRDPLGPTGDFTTAPEVSQMFGELIGLALAQVWIDQGRPTRFTLAELGPGRGTLISDLLRAASGVPGFLDAADIWLVEASPVLRSRQEAALKEFRPNWTSSASDLPDAPLFLAANEFFDALPVRQFVRDGQGWRERRIGLNDGALTFGLAQGQGQPALSHRLEDTQDGDLVEYCPSAKPILEEVGQRIAGRGGAALIIDYGDWRSLGDTLQAVRRHEKADPLCEPGKADLTVHVDFEALASASPCAHTRLTPQGVFLERLGITARARALADNASATARTEVIDAHRRLTHPEEMGNLFKVLGLFSTRGSPPPGLMV